MSFKALVLMESADILNKFASSSYQARNNMGGLADNPLGRTASRVKEFETNLGNVADLIRRTGVILGSILDPATVWSSGNHAKWSDIWNKSCSGDQDAKERCI